MICNVFGGMLNLAQPTNWLWSKLRAVDVQNHISVQSLGVRKG